jgi:hypothetical protein
MKRSLWTVFVLVSGLVGFLMGYSVSSYTGVRALDKGHVEQKVDTGGYADEE